jgi:hypothetical protein
MTGPLNSSKPTTSIITGGVYNATLPAPQDKQACALQLDSAGNLKVNVIVGGGGGGSNASVGLNGVLAPTSSTEIGFIGSGGLETPVSAANPLPITGSISATNPSVGVIGATAPSDATLLGVIDASGNLQGNSASNPVRTDPTGTTIQPVSGTVAVSNFPASQVVAGNLTNNNAVPGANNIGVLSAEAVPSYTALTYNSGDMVMPVTDTHGALNEDLQAVAGVALGATAVVAYGSTPAAVNVPGVNAFVTNFPATQPISGTVTALQGTSPWLVTGSFYQSVQPISGTIAISNFPSAQSVTQGTSPWVVSGTVSIASFPALQNVNLTQLNSVALGSPSNYGTSPGAVAVIGVNAFVTNPVAVTGTFWQATQPVSGTIAATQSGTWTVGISASQTIAVTNAGTFAVQATLAAETTKVIGTVNQGTSPWVVSGAVTVASTTITGTVATVATPSTTVGVLSNVQQALTTSINIKASAGSFYGFDWFNPNAVTVYIFIYNTATTPGTIGATTVLIYQKGLPAGAGSNIEFPMGIPCSAGIAIAVSTSPTSAAAPSTGLVLTTLYD